MKQACSRWILFDFDGTLVDSMQALVEVYQVLADQFHLKSLLKEDLLLLKGWPMRKLIQQLEIPLVKVPFLVRQGRLKFQDKVPALKLFEGMVLSLEALKEFDFVLGILTSNSMKNVVHFLELNSLQVFDVIYPEVSLFGKATVMRRFLRKQRLKADQVLYVGDEIRDIEAARRVGMAVASVTWGLNDRELLLKHQPDFLVNHPSELLAVCQQWSHRETST